MLDPGLAVSDTVPGACPRQAVFDGTGGHAPTAIDPGAPSLAEAAGLVVAPEGCAVGAADVGRGPLALGVGPGVQPASCSIAATPRNRTTEANGSRAWRRGRVMPRLCGTSRAAVAAVRLLTPVVDDPFREVPTCAGAPGMAETRGGVGTRIVNDQAALAGAESLLSDTKRATDTISGRRLVADEQGPD